MKTLKLKSYKLTPSQEKGEGVYPLREMPEELCKEMCNEHDAGPRHSWDSRFTYTTSVTNYKTIQLGTAHVAVILSLEKFYGYRPELIRIEKVNS